ncbi:MAG TPA: YibE/F family protein [Candidatus Paceibacterota bacterium]|nr:YibE/F family protein [Candidatus Paceibacterota bacterium]
MEHNHSLEKPNKYVVIAVLALSLWGLFYTFTKPTEEEVFPGVVKEVLSQNTITESIGDTTLNIIEQELIVEVKMGGQKEEIEILNDYKPLKEGDRVYVQLSLFDESGYTIADVSRTRGLTILAIFFVILAVLTSGWKGVYSLVGLLFSFAVIFTFMVPQILNGAPPVLIGIVGATLILIPALYLSYGLNKKSVAAFLGIIIALVFVGITSSILVKALGFTGLGEVSMFLDMESSSSINLVGLLIAGIIIAAVGVLDDVAAIQASVVFSLSSANKELRGIELFKEAMRVGRDHISAVINTLVLAYTGASLPLILLLSLREMPAGYFVSMEMVAEEIARTLVSSSGLLLAVPLTTLIATVMAEKTFKKLH